MRLIDAGVALFLCSLAIIPGLICGCQSPRSAESDPGGAVIITNRTPEEIRAATREIFQHHQYEAVRADGAELVFQKKGTFMNSLMGSDWFSGAAWVRVKVFQRALDPERILLDCDVYLVQQPEDPLFQEERKVGSHKKRYQSLLLEIAENLNRASATPRP